MKQEKPKELDPVKEYKDELWEKLRKLRTLSVSLGNKDGYGMTESELVRKQDVLDIISGIEVTTGKRHFSF
jgi:hypothetical protein